MDPKLFIPSQHALRRRTFPLMPLLAVLAVWVFLSQTALSQIKQLIQPDSRLGWLLSTS